MKRIAALLLVLCVLFGMCACTAPEAGETTEETRNMKYYPQIKEKLSWEKINSFPIKTADMTVEEMRALCVDFFRYTKTALWTPDENFDYIKNSKGTEDQMFKGVVYGGLPYIGVASGNIYRLMDYIDEETGIVDMSEATKNPKLFGNQCSIGAYWGWGRVINSAKYDWTKGMVQFNGFLRVGPYTYSDMLTRYSEIETTKNICAQNGMQVMFDSYAQMQPADGLVNYTTAGHVMMCSSTPVISYNDDGMIDGANSYLTVIDQAQVWTEGTNESGDTYQYKKNVDHAITFAGLYDSGYLPFTFAEFLGTNPVEDTVCSLNHTGDTVSMDQLMTLSVNANYGISDIYMILKDKTGKQVLSVIYRSEKANVQLASLAPLIEYDAWFAYADGKHTLEVSCQLSTGERPVLYTGKLVK